MLSFVWLFSFLTNQKNNAVLELRTEDFQELVGFEAKTKDLSCEAKTKDFKMCPHRLYLWLKRYFSNLRSMCKAVTQALIRALKTFNQSRVVTRF